MTDKSVTENQITRAKILSENLYSMLEQYSFMDLTESFLDANKTMDVLICARKVHDILESLYDDQVIDKINKDDDSCYTPPDIPGGWTEIEPRAEVRGVSLRHLLKKKGGKR